MRISAKKYAQTLYELTEGQDKKEIEKVLKEFTDTLVTNRDSKKVEKIIEYFQDIWNSRHGIVEAQAVTSVPANEETLEMIKEHISKTNKAEHVELENRTDKDIWGGVVLRYKDKVIDGSLRTQVKQLKKKLTK